MSIIAKPIQLVVRHQVWTALIGGAVVGLLLGLLVGYVVLPVEYINGTPGELRSDFQSNYLIWVANEYAATSNLADARARLGVGVGDTKPVWSEDDAIAALNQLADKYSGETRIRLSTLAQAIKSPESTTPKPSLLQKALPVIGVCGVFLLVAALLGGGWYLLSRWRTSRATPGAAGRRARITEEAAGYEPTSWGIEGPPVAQFPTTYVLGDDHYDPSFSIELENGEFMGECGVGVSETIGVGAPNKVTALEVWLFDKSDIRTVTKVLMSDYAFHDEALRAKLAPKGEPMLIEAGKDVMLETKTLRVRARIVEAAYGTGNLPPSSFFERLTIDLAAWVKPGQSGASSAPESETFAMPPTL